MKLKEKDSHAIVVSLPTEVVKAMKETGVLLAGGFIRDCLGYCDTPKDIDLWTNQRDGRVLRCFQQVGVEIDRHDMLTNVKGIGYFPIQVMHGFVFTNPEELVNRFDFSVCQAAIWYDKAAGEWDSYCSDAFYSDLVAKRLVYTGGTSFGGVAGSIQRSYRLTKRGYNPDFVTLAKMYQDAEESQVAGEGWLEMLCLPGNSYEPF